MPCHSSVTAAVAVGSAGALILSMPRSNLSSGFVDRAARAGLLVSYRPDRGSCCTGRKGTVSGAVCGGLVQKARCGRCCRHLSDHFRTVHAV